MTTTNIGEDAANGATLPAWFDTFLTNVCEIPDRNSPDDEPEAMIATAEELRNCAINAIEHFECQRSALTDPLQGWSVYVERNGEHFLTISNNHIAGAEITDELAALVRTAAAHLLSFAGNGQDHAGGYVGLSAEKTLSTNGAIGEREAFDVKCAEADFKRAFKGKSYAPFEILSMFEAWQECMTFYGFATPDHSALYIAEKLTGSTKDASFVQAHINQAVSEAMDRAALTAEKVAAEPVKQIAEHLTIMMMSAKCFVDHDDDDAVIGYRIKTGAIHQVIGLLAGMGCPVSIPSNMPLADDPDVQTNIAEWQAKYLPNDFVMGDNTRNIGSVVTPDSIAKAMRLDEIGPQPAQTQVALTDDARECLADVVSHYRALYAGLAFQLNEATVTENADDMAYWKHEIKTLERMYAQAERALLAVQPVSGGKS